MERVHIILPEHFLYSCQFRIDKEDINEARHMGNERILVFANTIRAKMFEDLHLALNDEQNGHGTIVANHSIHYKNEGFQGDVITCQVGVNTLTECSFDLVFQFVKENGKALALLRTGCVYYEYKERKIRPLPDAFLKVFNKHVQTG